MVEGRLVQIQVYTCKGLYRNCNSLAPPGETSKLRQVYSKDKFCTKKDSCVDEFYADAHPVALSTSIKSTVGIVRGVCLSDASPESV